MKKLLGIIVLGLLLSSNAYAAKRVCIAVHKNYSEVDKPILLAKRKMLFDAVGCQKGNVLDNIEDYKIYGYYKPDKFFELLYPKVTRDGTTNGWDKWTLDKFAKVLGESNYKFFDLPTAPERKLIAKKKEEERKREEEEKKIAEKPKKQEPKKQQPKSTPDDNKVVAAASGTGFFVSSVGHIISNHHVIEGCDATTLSFKGKEIKADILAVDKMNDLAILKAEVNPKKVYSVATEDASLLEDIIIAGYPLGKKVSAAIKTSKGSITALAGYGDNYSEFQTDAALNQGNSGGPIMNQKGNVIGVAVANYGKKSGVESFNFGIKSSTLKTFANANGLKFLPPNSREMSNKDLGKLITDGTVYLECYMTVAKIKRMIAEEKNRKAFFSEYQ